MGLLDNAISGALGYAISEASKSHPLRDLIDQKLSNGNNGSNETLCSLIDKYAHEHGVYASNDDFAHELHTIAETYETYYYDEKYGDKR